MPFKSLIYIESAVESPSTTTSIESFTRDPIDYVGSEWNLYEVLDSQPLVNSDPDGLDIYTIGDTSLVVLPRHIAACKAKCKADGKLYVSTTRYTKTVQPLICV